MSVAFAYAGAYSRIKRERTMNEQTKRKSALAWFEIPSRDLDRARRFYETILECTMHKDDFGSREDVMCIFPAENRRRGVTLSI